MQLQDLSLPSLAGPPGLETIKTCTNARRQRREQRRPLDHQQLLVLAAQPVTGRLHEPVVLDQNRLTCHLGQSLVRQ